MRKEVTLIARMLMSISSTIVITIRSFWKLPRSKRQDWSKTRHLQASKLGSFYVWLSRQMMIWDRKRSLCNWLVSATKSSSKLSFPFGWSLTRFLPVVLIVASSKSYQMLFQSRLSRRRLVVLTQLWSTISGLSLARKAIRSMTKLSKTLPIHCAPTVWYATSCRSKTDTMRTSLSTSRVTFCILISDSCFQMHLARVSSLSQHHSSWLRRWWRLWAARARMCLETSACAWLVAS